MNNKRDVVSTARYRYIIIFFFPDFVVSWPGLSPSHGPSCFSVIILDTSAIFAVSIFVSMLLVCVMNSVSLMPISF